MTRAEFRVLIKGMKAVYTDPKFLPDETSWEIWYRLLQDLDYKIADIALQRYMQTSVYPPHPADIRGQAARIASPEIDSISGEEAFALVRRSCRNQLAEAEKQFSKLPPLIQKALGGSNQGPGNLVEFACMDPAQFETVEKAQFLKSYAATCARKENDSMVSEKLMAQIEQTKAQLEKHDDPKRIEGGNEK